MPLRFAEEVKEEDGDQWSGFNKLRDRSQSSTTMERENIQKRTHEILTDDVGYWLSKLLELPHTLNSLTFWDECKDGVLLLKLLQILQPDLKIKPKSSMMCKRNNFFCIENVGQFLIGISDYVIPSTTFIPVHLVERSNEKQVITCLLQLSIFCGKHGILRMDQLPDAARFELEIEAMEEEMKNSLHPIEPDPHSFELPTPEVSDTEEEEEINDVKKKPVAIKEKKLVGFNLGNLQSLNWDETKNNIEREHEHEHDEDDDDVMTTEEMDAKRTSFKMKRTKSVRFVPQNDSPIDTALSGLLNNKGLNGQIDIKRIKPGCFVFGSTNRRYYVRELRNVLMIRVGGGWEELHSWLLRKIDEDGSRPVHVKIIGETQKRGPDSPRPVKKKAIRSTKSEANVTKKRSAHTTTKRRAIPKSATSPSPASLKIMVISPKNKSDPSYIDEKTNEIEPEAGMLSVDVSDYSDCSDVSGDEGGEAGGKAEKTKKKKRRKKRTPRALTTRTRPKSVDPTLQPARKGHQRAKSDMQLRMLERANKRLEAKHEAEHKKHKGRRTPRSKTTRRGAAAPAPPNLTSKRSLTRARTDKSYEKKYKGVTSGRTFRMRNVSSSGQVEEGTLNVGDDDINKLYKQMQKEESLKEEN